MKNWSCLLILTIAIALSAPLGFAKKNKPIDKGNSLENLFRPAIVKALKMSPDGNYAAGIGPIDGGEKGEGLIVYNLNTMKISNSFNGPTGYDIYQHQWLENDSIAYKVSQWDKWAQGLFRYNIKKRKGATLTGDDALVYILDANEETSDPAWVWIRSGRDIKPCLAKLRKNGASNSKYIVENSLISDKITEPEGDVYGWYIDHAHQPRGLRRFVDDALQYSFLEENGKTWMKLPLDPEDWDIELFHESNNQIYISGYNEEDTKGLYLYDLETNTLSEPLFRDSYYDFSETARFLTFNDRLLGFTYTRDVPTVVWLADEMKSVQKMLDSAIPNRINIIYDWNTTLDRLLVYSYSDTSPPDYLFVDLKNKALKDIARSTPWLEPEKLSKTEVFHFKTSDGLRLEGYLNRPSGIEAPYPTVVLVHGGPWARDYGTFDEEAQALATHGYAVLKVNYRGSIGYGKQISEDPEYDFKGMNRDITEAVQTAIKGGIVDPDRIAIMGASFGGYAAVSGAAFEPDLYRCAITNMGVFDWEEMTKSRKRQRSRYSYKKLVEAFGDPKEDKDKFEEISPIHHVDNIKIPIFVIHGKDDSNVSIRQSKMLTSALARNGVAFKTHFVGDEGHNIFEMKKRVKTYELILDFLAENLK